MGASASSAGNCDADGRRQLCLFGLEEQKSSMRPISLDDPVNCGLLIGDAPTKTLREDDAEFRPCHIKLTSVLWGFRATRTARPAVGPHRRGTPRKMRPACGC